MLTPDGAALIRPTHTIPMPPPVGRIRHLRRHPAMLMPDDAALIRPTSAPSHAHPVGRIRRLRRHPAKVFPLTAAGSLTASSAISARGSAPTAVRRSFAAFC
ncbi:hypothetical protein E2R62_22435 [Citrobacter rodentium]|uniref:Uncharacterized protein n=1 Tax=Citrobacter rodentium TaxID=67825 RepID=A0A482PV76_CITRO|nr:hypothetical protein E2R62_22435 [Citrobacter rodentium]HAT8012993.1 hypothetical protein [Citrobacter rodentium NBRC 105723 = DSM 16636]HAT8017703.1 hypothetical protein [Citrobacter rodentium]HAT8030016.1 hypothetical protein [Citrobacter rodentium]HAT8032508.1 hypothetical protein [Citrobacter rodentium]